MENSLQDRLEVTTIQARMKELRRDLDDDVQDIVEDARDMRDWRSYVRTYPWLCLGAAVAAGYLIVPRRTSGFPSVGQAAAELASQGRSKVKTLPPAAAAGRTLLTTVGNLVIRELTSYALQQASKILAPKDEQP